MPSPMPLPHPKALPRPEGRGQRAQHKEASHRQKRGSNSDLVIGVECAGGKLPCLAATTPYDTLRRTSMQKPVWYTRQRLACGDEEQGDGRGGGCTRTQAGAPCVNHARHGECGGAHTDHRGPQQAGLVHGHTWRGQKQQAAVVVVLCARLEGPHTADKRRQAAMSKTNCQRRQRKWPHKELPPLHRSNTRVPVTVTVVMPTIA